MFYVTFKWVDKKFFNMSEDERRAAMDALTAKAEAQIRGEIPADPVPVYSNPFPDWYRNAIKALPKVEDCKFDRENMIYTFKINIKDDDDFEDWAEATVKTLTDLIGPDQDRQKWAIDNHVQFTYTKSVEEELLAELDAHMHGKSEKGLKQLPAVELPQLPKPESSSGN